MTTTKTVAVDWSKVERGVPITNDSFFVRHEVETGYIYDDRGGYIHQNYCHIEQRRELVWITHDQSAECPISIKDTVLVETADGQLCLTSGYLVIWSNITRYRVVRQQIKVEQKKTLSSEVKLVQTKLARRNRTIFASFAVFFLGLFL